MVGQIKHYRWNDLASEQMNAATARRYINSDRVTLARFELKRGGVVPRHSHENEQVSYIVSGALKFKVSGQEIVVRGGEVIQIPSWVEHEVEILEDTIAIDVFSPVRQDWIDKRDSYFNAPDSSR
jgi:quercetin dioxygenase-like cupin family protein